MNSCSLTEITPERIIRAKTGIFEIPMAIIKFRKLDPNDATIAIANKIEGMDSKISQKRIIKVSIHPRSEEHTSELQSRFDLVCRLLLEKKKEKKQTLQKKQNKLSAQLGQVDAQIHNLDQHERRKDRLRNGEDEVQ